MGRKKQNLAQSAKRGLILKAAGEMFTTQGYSDVSMDSLASAVPVSKRTLYNHFQDKEALFTAVMQRRCQMIYEGLQQTIKLNQDPQKTLTAMARKILSVVFEPDAINIYRTAITEAPHFPELGELFYESGPRRSVALLSEYLARMHKEKRLHVTEPMLAASIFLGMLTNRMQMKCLLGVKKSVSRKEKDSIVRYAVEIFLEGLQP